MRIGTRTRDERISHYYIEMNSFFRLSQLAQKTFRILSWRYLVCSEFQPAVWKILKIAVFQANRQWSYMQKQAVLEFSCGLIIDVQEIAYNIVSDDE